VGEVPPGAGDVDGDVDGDGDGADGDDGVPLPPMPAPACAQAAPAADKTSAPLIANERTNLTIERTSRRETQHVRCEPRCRRRRKKSACLLSGLSCSGSPRRAARAAAAEFAAAPD